MTLSKQINQEYKANKSKNKKEAGSLVTIFIVLAIIGFCFISFVDTGAEPKNQLSSGVNECNTLCSTNR
jgi:hypothetical protein